MNAELAASLSRKPEVDPFSEVATRINERNQSAAVQNIDNVVQEEAKKAKLEIVEKEFLEMMMMVFFGLSWPINIVKDIPFIVI